ncbi:MAG: hypothetical protein K8H86_03995 [Ignavibacteriaceae bacterium]|nr:hypothetical protein [Ignavibacteriaceae bacterium]
MEWYIQLVKAYPIVTAMVQFALLGTLGDVISKWIIKKKIFLPYAPLTLFMKMGEWALLAIFIKYAFIGFHGFVDSLMAQGYLPEMIGLPYSFSISASMNLQFGPFLVIMHRLLDNFVLRESNWHNIDKGMYSLLWFWIPAHTITFILPKPFQIGLAAIWSVALGIILGYYNKKKTQNI